MANIVKYGEMTAEAIAATESVIQSGGQFLRFTVGKTHLRILPPPLGQQSAWVTVHEHFLNPPGGKPVRFACPRMMLKPAQACPACSRADELAKTGNRADRDRAWELRPKVRGYMAAINRKEPEKGVQVVAAGKLILDKLVKIYKDEEEWPATAKSGNFTHPVDGFDIVVTRVGTGKNDTNYEAKAAKAGVSRLAPTDDEIDEILDSAPDLMRFAKVPDADALSEMLAGDAATGEAEQEHEVAPARQLPARARTIQDDAEED